MKRLLWLLLIPVAVGFARLHLDVEILNLLPSNVPAVEGLKIQGADIVTLVPGEIEAKSPVDCKTNELFHKLTRVAVASDVVSNVETVTYT